MNKHIHLFTAALLICGASSAFAASSTDLTVTGTITPTACEPSLANNGVVDYGKISAKDLNVNGHTTLEPKSIQLTVNCDAAAQFAIRPVDNRPNTADRVDRYGLGLVNGTERLGNYALGFLTPVADMSVSSLGSNNQGQTWSPLTGIAIAPPNYWVAFGNQTAGVWTPAFVQNVTVDIGLHTYIVPARNLTLTNEVSLDGSVTLQIEYL